MVLFENVYSATEKAFRNDEFYELLAGRKGYNVSVLDAPVDVPTDWTVVISNGIYPLYKKSEDTKVKEYFQIALLKMMHGDSSEIWMAANILFIQLKNQENGNAAFSIDENLLREFSRSLDVHRISLENNKNYGGSDYPNGLLGDVERLNEILVNKYSVSMDGKNERL